MIGKNLARVREAKRLGLNELSRKAGVNAGYISAIENGTRKNPSLNILNKLAAALEVTVDRLTGESARGIIDERLDELGMSLDMLARRAGVPLFWLQNLDTFVPGDWDGASDVAYTWATKVAEVIGVPSTTLRAALARQEIPDPDPADFGPRISAEDDFKNLDKDSTVRVPIYTKLDSDPIGYDQLDVARAAGSDLYELRVSGSAMACAGINEQDFVIVRNAEKTLTGDLALVQVSGEMIIRKVYPYQNNLILLSDPASPPQVVRSKEIKIFGKIIGVKKFFTE